jgi:sigma-B regulation protein RsbU (phosphoserine phosphatase)
MAAEYLKAADRVLAVDDNEVNREILNELLRRSGFTVKVAEDGDAALKLARSWQPDIILMDVMMPGKDGFSTVRELKELPGLRDIPIIFMTALTDNQSKLRAFEVGAVDYLTKPFYAPELVARVRIHLQLRRSYQQLVTQQLEQLKRLQAVSQQLLPAPDVALECGCVYQHIPKAGVGGDCFELFKVDPDRTDYIIADVCGHGIDAFMPASALLALLRQNVSLGYEPLQSVQLVNRHIKQVMAEGTYLTLAYLRLDRRRGRALFVNAGHVCGLLQRGSRMGEMAVAGDPVGCFEDFAPGKLECEVRPGDRLVLFSDGVVETLKGAPVSRATGLQALKGALIESASKPLPEVAAWVLKALHPDVETAGDDLLLAVIEV